MPAPTNGTEVSSPDSSPPESSTTPAVSEATPYGFVPRTAGARRARFRESATAALALGIAAFLTGWVPLVGTILGALAVTYALIALAHALPKRLAITGLVLGLMGFTASTLLTIGSLFAIATWDTIGPLLQPQVAVVDDEDAGARANAVGGGTGAPEGDFASLDDASFAALLEDPTAAYGTRYVVHGELQYVDDASGDCAALVMIDDAQQDDWEAYAVPSWLYPEATDGSCGALLELDEYLHVTLWVTVDGQVTSEREDGTVDDVIALVMEGYEVLPSLPE